MDHQLNQREPHVRAVEIRKWRRRFLAGLLAAVGLIPAVWLVVYAAVGTAVETDVVNLAGAVVVVMFFTNVVLMFGFLQTMFSPIRSVVTMALCLLPMVWLFVVIGAFAEAHKQLRQLHSIIAA